MVRPSGVRALAGFTLGERLGQDIYGEIYRASGDGRTDVRLRIVTPRLAAAGPFGVALGRVAGPVVDALRHPAVVTTLLVVRDGAHLVVVTEGVSGAITLAEVLSDPRTQASKTPPRIAAAIARSVIDALATAHAGWVVHGAVHPRSVLIDQHGVVRLTDFAVGLAAATAGAAGSVAMPLTELAGYLPPEVAQGEPPGPASDVYAAGALLYMLLTGAAPPGSLHTTPAIERLVQRALDPDLARRFGDATSLQESFAEAIDDDRWEIATADEVARFVGPRAPVEQSLDAATEDLLASLGGSVEVTRPRSEPGAGSAGAARRLDVMAVAPPRTRSRTGGLDSILSELEDTGDGSIDGPHTMVDAPGGQAARDPISELIELESDREPTNVVDGSYAIDPEHTPLPPPQPDEPGTMTREGSAPRPMRRPELSTAPSRLVEATRPRAGAATRATSRPDADDEPVAAAPAPAAAPRPAPVRRAAPATEEVAVLDPPRLGRSPVWTWIGLLVVAAGATALVLALLRQGEERQDLQAREARDRDAKAEAAAVLERRLRAEQADPGTIAIRSTPDGAAVWLLLGRTPFDSIPLSTENVWELRVEREGHVAQDVRVGGAEWSGPKDARRAAIEVTLQAGTPTKPLPGLPAAPPASDLAGLAEGSGTLHAVTMPAGAAVWLLVGQTNSMSLTGIEAGRDYELKVAKDGFLPEFVRVSAEEWRAGGDPRLPLSAAPKKETIDRAVTLLPQPAGGR